MSGDHKHRIGRHRQVEYEVWHAMSVRHRPLVCDTIRLCLIHAGQFTLVKYYTFCYALIIAYALF